MERITSERLTAMLLRPRKRKRWMVRAAVALALLIGVPLTLALVTVYTPWGRARITRVAVDVIREELNLKAGFRHVGIEMFPPLLRAEGITLDDPVHGRFAQADSLTIRPSFFAFLRGHVDLAEVRLDGPTVNLIIRDGVIVNLPKPRARPDSPSTPPSEIPVRHLLIRGARLAVDAAPHGSAVLEGVRITVRAKKGLNVDVHVHAAAGAATHAKGKENLYGFELKGSAGPSGIHVDRLKLVSETARLALSDGHLPIPFSSDYRGKAYARVDLGRVMLLPLPVELPPLVGVVEVDGRVSGSADGPVADGTVRIDGVKIEQWGFGRITMAVHADKDAVVIREGLGEIVKGGGKVGITGRLGLSDPALPLAVNLDLQGLRFAKLMDQLGVSENAVVDWNVTGPIKLAGTIVPLAVDGPLHIKTKDFEVTAGAYHASDSPHVVGVSEADIRARVSVKPEGIRFYSIDAATPRSRIKGDVLLGFDNRLVVNAVADPIDLLDASPLLTFPLTGKGKVSVKVDGEFTNPSLTGHIHATDFSFDTFPLGEVRSDAVMENEAMSVRFPLITVKSGGLAPAARVERRARRRTQWGSSSAAAAARDEAALRTKREVDYTIHDLLLDFRNDQLAIRGRAELERYDLAEFFRTFHFDEDERFDDYDGQVTGTVELDYTRGARGDGPDGTMRTRLALDGKDLQVDDFHFGSARVEGDWIWREPSQGIDGGELVLREAALKKGQGTLAVSGGMAMGGKLDVGVAIDRFSLHELEGLGDRFEALSGVLSGYGSVKGTASLPRLTLEVNITNAGYGRALLGGGQLAVRLTDKDDPWLTASTTRGCAKARAGLAAANWPADGPVRTASGPKPRLEKPMAFLVCGALFGERVALDLAVGRTRTSPLRGTVAFGDLDLGPFLRHHLADDTARGTMTGQLSFTDGAPRDPGTLAGTVALESLSLRRGATTLRTSGPLTLALDQGTLRVDRAVFDAAGSEFSVQGSASLTEALALRLEGSLDLAVLATFSPRISQASGLLAVEVDVGGTWLSPRVEGRAELLGGAFRYAGFPAPITDLGGVLTFGPREVSLSNFRGKLAGGDVTLSGAAWLAGLRLDRYELKLGAENLTLRPLEGVEAALGAALKLEWSRGQRVPRVGGEVSLERVVYSRPTQLLQTLSLGEIGKQQRAAVTEYDPDDDSVELDVVVRSGGLLRVQNNVIDADIRIQDTDSPFRIVGTDQRLGVLGNLEVRRGSVLFRNARFDVRRGVIEFRDPTRVNPSFDVLAVTDVRRAGGFAGPNWRVNLHAYGSVDSFRLDTSSDPVLSQEDIVLLLTMGMTRAEADQLQAGNLSESAALEALATVTGINREVRRAVPVIDDFRVSSQYNPRTNRTEPQVAVGKRLSERVRASASTGLSDSREVRTAVEWRVGGQTTLQASYDNMNASTASSVGNIGVDLRWRLEFQ